MKNGILLVLGLSLLVGLGSAGTSYVQEANVYTSLVGTNGSAGSAPGTSYNFDDSYKGTALNKVVWQAAKRGELSKLNISEQTINTVIGIDSTNAVDNNTNTMTGADLQYLDLNTTKLTDGGTVNQDIDTDINITAGGRTINYIGWQNMTAVNNGDTTTMSYAQTATNDLDYVGNGTSAADIQFGSVQLADIDSLSLADAVTGVYQSSNSIGNVGNATSECDYTFGNFKQLVIQELASATGEYAG